MQNAFRILKPIQKSLKCVWVFRNTGANAFAKNQTRLAYEDKRDLYCTYSSSINYLFLMQGTQFSKDIPINEASGVHSGHIQTTHYSSLGEDKIIYTFCITI